MLPDNRLSKNYEQDYEIVKKVGEGSFGKVFKAIRKSDGKTIALKVLQVPDPKDLENIQTELQLLKKLNQETRNRPCNNRVVCYYDSYYDQENQYILIEMEYIDGETLTEHLFKSQETLSEETYYNNLLILAKEISEGLKYSHDKNIIHNDIKADNIMIRKITYDPVIIDYGLSCNTKRRLNWKNYCVGNGGTPEYIAPEYLTKDQMRFPASDMWALGILLYIAAIGESPYKITEITTIEELFNMILNDPPKKVETSNNHLNYLINSLLKPDMRFRMTSQQVIDYVNRATEEREYSQNTSPKVVMTALVDSWVLL